MYERFIEKKAVTDVRSQVQPPPSALSNSYNIHTTNPQDPSPMEIGNLKKPRIGPLTVEEKSRRFKLGLCLYCGSGEHRVDACKLRPKVVNATISTSDRYPFVVSVKLYSNSTTVTTLALIDSGASASFMDEKFAKFHNINLVTKKIPYTLQVVDGRPISSGTIDGSTVSLRMSLDDHSESISFDITKIGSYPLILGIDWLRKHNPLIEWSLGKLFLKNCPPECSGTFSGVSSLPENYLESKDSENFFESLKNDMPPIIYHLSVMPESLTVTAVPVEFIEFSALFSTPEEEMGLPPRTKFDHKIEVAPDTVPPCSPIYRLSATETQVLKEEIDKNLRRGLIRPSSSPYGSPVLFSVKSNGKLRLCVDYRKLNKLTKKNKYPLPLISQCLDRLSSAKVFTSLDLRGAFNLIRIAEGDEEKTAFRTPFGLFEYLVMPFGLTNGPSTFQSFMNNLLSNFLDAFVVCY